MDGDDCMPSVNISMYVSEDDMVLYLTHKKHINTEAIKKAKEVMKGLNL